MRCNKSCHAAPRNEFEIPYILLQLFYLSFFFLPPLNSVFGKSHIPTLNYSVYGILIKSE